MSVTHPSCQTSLYLLFAEIGMDHLCLYFRCEAFISGVDSKCGYTRREEPEWLYYVSRVAIILAACGKEYNTLFSWMDVRRHPE